MSLTIHDDILQGTEAWHQLRLGLVTASTVGALITPAKIAPANNETARGLVAALAAERITGWADEIPMSSDMWRGVMDEPIARAHYAEHHAPVFETGFMVLDRDGMRLGYSPDGLVGDNGLIEIKSRKAKTHLQTILTDTVPAANMAQLQAGLLVSGRAWIDYVSWCGGMPMHVIRVTPDPRWFDAITTAVESAETAIAGHVDHYATLTAGRPATERINYNEEIVI